VGRVVVRTAYREALPLAGPERRLAKMIWALGLFAATAITIGTAQAWTRRRPPLASHWLAEFPADRYRPMLRLLDEGDFQHLREQPGFRPDMEVCLREQRVRMIRAYLRVLTADFRRVCHGLRHVPLAPGCGRLRLRWILGRQQATFARELITVRFCLALYRSGITGADMARLMMVFDAMRLALTAMTLLAERAPV